MAISKHVRCYRQGIEAYPSLLVRSSPSRPLNLCQPVLIPKIYSPWGQHSALEGLRTADLRVVFSSRTLPFCPQRMTPQYLASQPQTTFPWPLASNYECALFPSIAPRKTRSPDLAAYLALRLSMTLGRSAPNSSSQPSRSKLSFHSGLIP